MNSVQTYSERGWTYLDELQKFVESGGNDNDAFINAVSGIVNRGCHDPPCGTGPVDGSSERASNFHKVLDVFFSGSFGSGGSGSGSGKSEKSGGGGGTKSGKSGCTDCSADTLTRANTLTSLTFDTYGDNGVLNYQSLVDFCCNPEEREVYLDAIEFTSGCLAYTDCLIGDVFDKVGGPDSTNATVTEGAFLTASVNTLCLAEQMGVKLPIGGETCRTPEELCSYPTIPLGACGGNPLA